MVLVDALVECNKDRTEKELSQLSEANRDSLSPFRLINDMLDPGSVTRLTVREI